MYVQHVHVHAQVPYGSYMINKIIVDTLEKNLLTLHAQQVKLHISYVSVGVQ